MEIWGKSYPGTGNQSKGPEAGTHRAGSELGKTGEPWMGQRVKRKDQRGRQSQGHYTDKEEPWGSLSKK